MDIFEATLKTKEFIYDNNPQLIKVDDFVEVSGFSWLTFFNYLDIPISEYKNKINIVKQNYLFDPDVIHNATFLKEDDLLYQNYEKLTANNVNTKEYWNFLHKNFPFCDVSSYYKVTDLATYFEVKGKHYDLMINKIGINAFKNKKILEIGPGYGYLPKVLTENKIKHQYYCADIVKRFDHDGFIDIDGYTLSNITDKYDIIVMVDVLSHLGKDIFQSYILEMRELLNENGYILILTEGKSQENGINHFFGQTYHQLGINAMIKILMVIGFDVTINPISLAYNNYTNLYKLTLKEGKSFGQNL